MVNDYKSFNNELKETDLYINDNEDKEFLNWVIDPNLYNVPTFREQESLKLKLIKFYKNSLPI